MPARPVDDAARAAARGRQAELAAPANALGRLGELAVWLAGCTGDPRPAVRARLVVAAADHGIAGRGVSAGPRAVTREMVAAFAAGQGAGTALAAAVDAGLEVVDAGLGEPLPGVPRIGIGPSADASTGPALDTGAVAAAVDWGRTAAARAAADGMTVVAGGGMGIGDATSAACLTAWLTGRPVAEVAGAGTGADAAGLAVAERALALHARAIRGPLGALRRLGGGDVAVLCGLALGAGEHGLAYVCDGRAGTAAAGLAVAIEPGLRPRLLAGHRTADAGHAALLDALGLEPLLDLGICLGDGSGAAAALAVLRLACAAHDGMGVSHAGMCGRPSAGSS